MSDGDPTPRQVAKEIALYAGLMLVVGAAFVAARVWREGPRVLHFDPRSGEPETPPDGTAGEGATEK